MDTDESKSFVKHVFKFDDESKAEIFNLLQYVFLAILPIVFLNKTMQKYVPEADEQKSSIEITAEVLLQIVGIFLGLLIIHRMLTYVPTYSGVNYPDVHIIYNVLAILMITLSLQTKMGEKVSILTDRLYDLWNGKETKNSSGKSKNVQVKVSQPISGQPVATVNATITPQYTDGTAISSLPNYDVSQGMPATVPNYDAMYRPDTTPLVGAATPGGMEPMEPMAANSVLGGGAFGSW